MQNFDDGLTGRRRSEVAANILLSRRFQDERDGEINPSKFVRKNLDLFANVRPARTYPGLRNRFGAFDLVA